MARVSPAVLLLAMMLASSSDIVAATQGGNDVTKPGFAQSAQAWHTTRGLFFKRNWGVEIIGVRPVSDGQMLTFRYRVLDADKAKPMFDKTAKPYLIDEATGIKLAVPTMENVGELRQTSLVETDRNYFMIFGNPGKVVKTGNRVSIVIGSFRIENMIVD